MHPSVTAWIQAKVDQHSLAGCSTLEVGAQNINGSPRSAFAGKYVGVDMVEGKGVDIVASAAELPFADENFDVVVSTEMLEHDSTFWLSMAEMGRVLRPGGHLLLTTRGIGFQYHGYPDDFYRFTQDAMRHLLVLAGGLTEIELAEDTWPEHPGWFLHGQKETG